MREQKRHLLTFWQGVQGSTHFERSHLAQEKLRRLLRTGSDSLVLVFSGLLASGAVSPQTIDGEVVGHGQEPGARSGARLIGVGFLPGAQEGLLRDVLGVGDASEQTARIGDDHGEVLAGEFSKCQRIALGDALEEDEVTLEVLLGFQMA